METTPLMLDMGESCSLYPDEMECFYGDPYLCKVEKGEDGSFENLPSFTVSSVCNDYGVADMLFHEYLLDSDEINEPFVDTSLKDSTEIPNVYHSSCESKDELCEVIALPAYPLSVVAEDELLSNCVLSEIEIGQTSPATSCFRRQTKNTKNGRSISVENIFYSRRKTCTKRKSLIVMTFESIVFVVVFVVFHVFHCVDE